MRFVCLGQWFLEKKCLVLFIFMECLLSSFENVLYNNLVVFPFVFFPRKKIMPFPEDRAVSEVWKNPRSSWNFHISPQDSLLYFSSTGFKQNCCSVQNSRRKQNSCLFWSIKSCHLLYFNSIHWRNLKTFVSSPEPLLTGEDFGQAVLETIPHPALNVFHFILCTKIELNCGFITYYSIVNI